MTTGNTQKLRIDWSGRAFDYTPEEIEVVVQAMKDADPLTQGRYLKQFESDFSQYNGSPHSFAVANCTNALDLSALLSRIGPGDEVIIPAHTFCATAIPFIRTGARIVWADIDPDTRLVSADTLQKVLTPRTKVIVVVHLYGLMADMDAIMDLASQHGVLVVEDCAQAIGAEFKGIKSGAWGDFGTFSFHAQKNMTTLGEGGVLTVKDPELAQKTPGVRHNGVRPFDGPRDEYWIPAMSNVDLDFDGVAPYNFCLGEIQCALGSALLKRLDSMNDLRIRRANQFREALAEFEELSFQKVSDDHKHCYHLLAARYDGNSSGKHRDDLIRMMFNEYGVKVIVQYYPLYRYPLFRKFGFGEADCPETDRFFDNMVSFPFHIWMNDSDFDYMIESTQNALRRLRG